MMRRHGETLCLNNLYRDITLTSERPSIQIRLPPRDAKLNPYIRRGRKLVLPVLLRDRHVTAVPDTGSHINAIDASLVKSLGLNMTPGRANHTTVKLGDGGLLKSIGAVSIYTSFVNEASTRKSVKFEVFDRLVGNVQIVLGNKFLESTETMTKHQRRLAEFSPGMEEMPRIMKMSSPTRLLTCSLEDREAHAVADTGSDLNLVSSKYAETRGFRIQPVSDQERHIALPGGRTALVTGKVRLSFGISNDQKVVAPEGTVSISSVDGTVGQNPNSMATQPPDPIFYVLPSLTSDVLLGGELLDSIDAFGARSHNFVDVEAIAGAPPHMRAIKWLSETDKKISRFCRRVRGKKAAGYAEESLTEDEREAIEKYTKTEIDHLQMADMKEFYAALSVREAHESSRRRTIQAELADMARRAQHAHDPSVATALAQSIAELRDKEAQTQDEHQSDRDSCVKAWHARAARRQQKP